MQQARQLGIPEGMRDMDHVITTRELAQWAKEARHRSGTLWRTVHYDRLMGEASGAGVIFGNTGGVMEAALRTAYAYLTGRAAPGNRFWISARPRLRGRAGSQSGNRRT